MTRCFGWSLPHTSVIPFADCANHFIIDNQYELINKRLHNKKKNGETVTPSEEKYFTQCKMRINCDKHFKEDDEEVKIDEVPYKTKRYIRKLKMRNECSALEIKDFVLKEEYRDMNIWDLKYISTSDEEDNDSS